jgi:transposase
MARQLVSDELWNLIEPLLPPDPPRRFRHPGRKRVPNRACLAGIVFVLKTGIPWEDLPQEMGCGSGMTCWRRLREWQEAGVWQELHAVLLDNLRAADRIDWSRAVVDSASLRSVGAGEKKRPQSNRSSQARQQTPRRHRR